MSKLKKVIDNNKQKCKTDILTYLYLILDDILTLLIILGDILT